MTPELLQLLSLAGPGPHGSIDFPGLGLVIVLTGPVSTNRVRHWIVSVIREAAQRDLITAMATPEDKVAP